MDRAEEMSLLQEEHRKVADLIKHPGYVWLLATGEEQLRRRVSDLILAAPEGMDDMMKKAYAMGECAGIKLMCSVTAVQEGVLAEEIKKIQKGMDDGS